MTKPRWFKRKRYGWGWTPATWHGWLILALFFLAILKNFIRIDNASRTGTDTLIVFVPETIILVGLLILICWLTGEKPRWQWGGKGRPEFLHTRLRVGNLEESIGFYEKLGFILVKRTARSPAGNELVFLEIPGNAHVLELAYSPKHIPKVPEDLVHTAIGYSDLISKCDELEKKSIAIWPDGWREKFKTEKKMAFVTDPDGYEVELLERD